MIRRSNYTVNTTEVVNTDRESIDVSVIPGLFSIGPVDECAYNK